MLADLKQTILYAEIQKLYTSNMDIFYAFCTESRCERDTMCTICLVLYLFNFPGWCFWLAYPFLWTIRVTHAGQYGDIKFFLYMLINSSVNVVRFCWYQSSFLHHCLPPIFIFFASRKNSMCWMRKYNTKQNCN